MAMRNMPGARARNNNDHSDITVQVTELRAQLEKIQRATVEAQLVLSSLAPQIDEFASWVSDLEAVVGRWHTPRDEQQVRQEEAA